MKYDRFFYREVWQWYQQIPLELEEGILNNEEEQHLREYYREAGLLTFFRISFFKHHFCRTFSRAAAFLLEGKRSPLIVDLGAGCGTQSLFLALHGARVRAIDADATALSVLEKRKRYYEQRYGRALDIEVFCSDVFKFPYASLGKIDGFYSMFAFNMMQPSDRLLSLVLPFFAPDARFAVLDGNNISWLPRLVPARRRSVWTPPAFADFMIRHGFSIEEHEGGIVIPPPLWNLDILGCMSLADSVLRSRWLFPISHQILARKKAAV